MSDYFGDIRLGDTIDIKFTTRQISGAPFTLAGSPVISAYPANSTTQLTAGITLTVDFDAVTGYNNVRVVASGGNGYLTATNYDLCITTGTVNSVSVVGESIGSFSIENRSALMPATAGRTAVVDASGLIDANAVKVGPTGSGTAQTAGDIFSKVTGLTFTIANQVDCNVLTFSTAFRAGIRKNVALAKFPFLMTDSTNHNPSASLAVTVTRSIDGGAFAAGTLSAVTELSNGFYSVDFGAGDLNGTMITLRCTAAASDDLFLTIHTDP